MNSSSSDENFNLTKFLKAEVRSLKKDISEVKAAI